MANIQGLGVPGLLKPHLALLGMQIPLGLERDCKALIANLVPRIATAAQVLADRRDFRNQRTKARTQSYMRAPAEASVFVGIAVAYSGLVRLTPGAAYIGSKAFQLGLAARSALLGDPTDPASEGNPANWVVGGVGSELDLLVIVGGDDPDQVGKTAEEVAELCRHAGMTISYRESGNVREGAERGHEHFGFEDGVSQPGIRGRASAAQDDFITERYVEESEVPQSALFGYPGQDLVWPGELVLGYAASSPDPLIAGPVASLTPAWTADGTFLVFRRLRQDVGLFWRTMRTMAAELAVLPGFAGITDVQLAARLVGRWPSGAPFNRTPSKDDPQLGAEVPRE